MYGMPKKKKDPRVQALDEMISEEFNEPMETPPQNGMSITIATQMPKKKKPLDEEDDL